MTSIAVERPVARAAGASHAGRRGVLLLVVLGVLWGLWEGYRALGIHFGWQHPFTVDAGTMPLLAIAPMVVIWLASIHVTAWISVSVIAAYLTFFPVVIATLRGLQAADQRAVELMRSYAANRWTVLWKLRFPTSLPFLFSALRVSATASIVGAIIGESPSSIAGGLGGAILNFAQYYTFQPQNLWATNIIAALLGIAFFLAVVGAEKIVVRRAPEHVA